MTVNVEQVRSIIDDVVIGNMNKQPDLFGNPKGIVTKELMYSKSRKKEYVVCRQLHMYVASYVLNNILDYKLTLAMNGYRLGCDHATTLHSIKTIKNLYGTDAQILRMVCDIIDAVIRRIKDGENNKRPHRWWNWLYPKSELF